MYQFDPAIAQQHWVSEAIFYQSLIFWCAKNKANNKNNFDWKYWTYNSKTAYAELFPFWTERQIKTIIESLLKQWLIQKWCFNENKYDHTNWYTPSDQSVLSIGQKSPIVQTKKSNHIILTDNKPNSKPKSKTQEVVFVPPTENEVAEFLQSKWYNKTLAKEFYDHYSADNRSIKGWKPMENRKKAIAWRYDERYEIKYTPQELIKIAEWLIRAREEWWKEWATKYKEQYWAELCKRAVAEYNKN